MCSKRKTIFLVSSFHISKGVSGFNPTLSDLHMGLNMCARENSGLRYETTTPPPICGLDSQLLWKQRKTARGNGISNPLGTKSFGRRAVFPKVSSTGFLQPVVYKPPHYLIKKIADRRSVVVSILRIQFMLRMLLLELVEMDDDENVLPTTNKRSVLGKTGTDLLFNHSFALNGDLSNPFVEAQLNGSHGEWTESDDVKNRGGARKGTKRNPRRVRKQRGGGSGKRFIKSVGRTTAKAALGMVASHFTGDPLSGAAVGAGAYGAIARIIRYSGLNSRQELQLSFVASQYLKSFINPFDASLKQICLPRTPGQPSYKCTGFVRGTGYIGLQGFGFVAYTPTLCNDQIAVVYSTAAYNQLCTSAIANDIGVLTGTGNSPGGAHMTNLPYTYAQMSTANVATRLAGRVVNSSLQCEYTGTVFNSSGMWYAYSDPNNDVVTGADHNNATPASGMTVADLSAKDACEITNVTRNGKPRTTVLANAVNEYDYPGYNGTAIRKSFPFCQAVTATNPNTGAPCSVIAITGKAGEPFYYELITHCEYIGAGVTQSLLTESQTDAVGFDAVQSIAARAQRRCASDARLTFSKAIVLEMKAERIRMDPRA